MKRPPLQNKRVGALQNKRVAVLQMAFRVRNVFGTFEKRTLGYKIGKGKKKKKKKCYLIWSESSKHGLNAKY